MGAEAPGFVVAGLMIAVGLARLIKHRRISRPFDQHGGLDWGFAAVVGGIVFMGIVGMNVLSEHSLASMVSQGRARLFREQSPTSNPAMESKGNSRSGPA